MSSVESLSGDKTLSIETVQAHTIQGAMHYIKIKALVANNTLALHCV